MEILIGITPEGFRKAVKDYNAPAVIEEMAANSFDADAKNCLVLLDTMNNHLYIMDDGHGFRREELNHIGTIGGGSKASTPGYSLSNRPYLGSYGFGLKSTLNISSRFDLITTSKDGTFHTTVDWDLLEEKIKSGTGFEVKNKKTPAHSGTGTLFKLFLRSPMSKKDLEAFGKVLGNLPIDGGTFKPYFSLIDDIGNLDINKLKFSELGKKTEQLFKTNKIKRPGVAREADLKNSLQSSTDDKDNDAKINYWFGGIQYGHVKPIKSGLRGIYVRIHGRLLKHIFTESKYTYAISHFKQFESGLRVEIEADWLRDQITLSRDGLNFSNEKLEKDFTKMLQKNVSGFINPRLRQIQARKKAKRDKQLEQRRELCQKRIQKTSDIAIPGLSFSGFSFKPESDAELALLISQKEVMKKINENYTLIDYNDQTSFDCMIYDSSRADFVYTELEPHLISFLEHKNRERIQLIIVWDRSKWRVGAGKRSGNAYFKLINKDHDKSNGHYKLIEYPSSKSKKPRTDYNVIVIEEVLS